MPYSSKKKMVRKSNASDMKIRKVARAEARKAVKREAESKMFDGTIIDVATTAGSVYSMTRNTVGGNNMTQGSGDTQYVGTSITPNYLTVRGSVTFGDAQNIVRVVIIQTIGGGVPTPATVFQNVNTGVSYLSAYNRSFNNTFRVLLDRLYAVSEAGPQNIAFKYRLGPKLLRKIHFNDANGAIERDGIYLLTLSDSALAVPSPAVDFYHRITYKDS